MEAVDQEEAATTMEIAVLTVIKTGSILKNIILNSPPPPSGENRGSGTESFLLGRHPGCHIILDHPSISRFHAKLLVEPSRRRLSLTDLSSVHGTWVSGRRIDPGISVNVGEGEILMLGASTRVYVLKWIPLENAFELGKLLESVSEECPLQEEDDIDYDEDGPLGISIPSAEPESSPPPRSGGQIVPSSLLSRRKKSISHLQIHGSKKSREQCSDFSMEQVEELVPKALFNNDVDGSDDEEVHFSNNKNLTPTSTSNQKISKKLTCSLQRPCLDVGGREDQEVENFISNSRELLLELDAEEDVYYESDRENVTPVTEKVETEVSSLGRQGSTLMGQEEQEGTKGNQTPNRPESSEAKEKLQTEYSDLINSIIAERRGDRAPLKSLLENFNFTDSSFSDVTSPCTEQEESVFMSTKGIVGETSTARRKQKGEKVPFRSPLNKFAPTAKSSPLSNCSGSTKAKQVTVGKTRIRREDAQTNHSQETLLEVLSDVENKASTANGSSSTSVVVDPQKYFSTDGSADIPEFQSGKNPPERKKWNLVVDIGCLTDDESRRSLQLLEGIRGTQLTIPSMVIRELDYLNRQESLFRRKSKALVALQWIEQCMVNTGWWIHVQSSGEIASPAPTPPSTPRTDAQTVGNERGEEQDITVPPNSRSSFAWRDSVAITSPTAEDHVLNCALMFKRMKAEEEHVVLTNNISLKIKAMAEGFLCETPKEFRASLVNPFSKRFLWAGSSPRGLSWSLSEEVGKIENLYYNNSTARKPSNATESARGLKLILLR